MLDYVYRAAAVFNVQLDRQRTQSKLTGLAASCPGLDQDRLADPSNWTGYLDCVSSTPYDDEPIVRMALFDYWDGQSVLRSRQRDSREIPRFDLTKRKAGIYYVAFHYPGKTVNCQVQTKTIYRWELIVAWETLRQIALTRTFLFLAAQQESSSDWTKPKAESLIVLGEWASAARNEFERLEQHLQFLARCENASIRIRGWSQDEHILDRISQLDSKAKSDDNRVNYVRAFPCKIFSRCKSIIRGECILFSGKIPVGLIRALVQKVEAYQPIGTEPPPISWWRGRLDQGPHECWRTYRLSSDFRLDVQTPYKKEVDRWLLPPALRDESSVPQSDLGEEFDRKMTTVADSSRASGIQKSDPADDIGTKVGQAS